MLENRRFMKLNFLNIKYLKMKKKIKLTEENKHLALHEIRGANPTTDDNGNNAIYFPNNQNGSSWQRASMGQTVVEGEDGYFHIEE